jgi:hypothetical protein
MTPDTDKRTGDCPARDRDALQDAIELCAVATFGGPARSYPGTGGIWLRRNVHRPDAEFIDWGLARAVAEILNALADGRLVRTA